MDNKQALLDALARQRNDALNKAAYFEAEVVNLQAFNQKLQTENDELRRQLAQFQQEIKPQIESE